MLPNLVEFGNGKVEQLNSMTNRTMTRQQPQTLTNSIMDTAPAFAFPITKLQLHGSPQQNLTHTTFCPTPTPTILTTPTLRPETPNMSLILPSHLRGPQPNKKPPAPMPMVAFGDTQMDVYSRLAKDRILLLGRAVDDEVANMLVAQMLFLSSDAPDKDITLYINSPGGSVSAGLAIFDTMQYIPCDISTVCFGCAASMGAFLLGAGTKGKRKSLPNARIMIHQPLGGAQGQAADIAIQATELSFIKRLLNSYMAEQTGQKVEKIEVDTDRDFFMSPEEAMEYGIIDEVITTKNSVQKPERVAFV
eukprot:Plantae.Rhodophyta-Hildenbrandia_rubra.ctg15087.p1 GENE.Plantae.Rhodophyta-Hildenbrandia_rubra.ctg15087~~Plantae.Rhodophyta-Hildenbrandia_rubra.ctg15087.p1  ORF type:complete len:305 (-),score=25.88 Plantae.Rhodophyta-Hildenbrandia_rubra.ctg15087:153-1067(-)